MKRTEALHTVLKMCSSNDLAVFSTGMISREAFSVSDRSENFYMVGSMGLAGSFAFGVSRVTKKRVFVFDGDGSALMELGMLAVNGFYQPANLVHCVLDNQSYQSTGGQKTISSKIALDQLAQSAGYSHVWIVTDLSELQKGIEQFLNKTGPLFLLMKVNKESAHDVSRVSLTCEELRKRFSQAIQS